MFVLNSNKLSAAVVFFTLILSAVLLSAEEQPESAVTVKFDIPDSYGPWQLDGQPQKNKGKREKNLTEGNYVLSGDYGWKVEFKLRDNNIIPENIVSGKYGRDLSGLLCYGSELKLPDPIGRRVIISIPAAKGSYSIAGLLKEGKGDRAVFLPIGKNIIKGKDWQINLNITEQGGTAELADKKTESTSLVFSGNIFKWQTTAENPGQKKENNLQIFSNRNRKYYNSSEYMLLNMSLFSNAAVADTLTVSALQGEKETVIMTCVWNASAGSSTKSFEIPLAILKPGKYKLRARFNGLTADKELEILTSSAQRECLTKLIDVTHSRDVSSLAKAGFSAAFINADDFCREPDKQIAKGLDLYLLEGKKNSEKGICSRAVTNCLSKAREYNAVKGIVINLSDKDIPSLLSNDFHKEISQLNSSAKIKTFVDFKKYLEKKDSFSENTSFIFSGIEAAVNNDITEFLKFRIKHDIKGCLFAADSEQYAWASLIAGAEGAAANTAFSPEFIDKWKKFSGFVAAVMNKYYEKEKQPVFKVAENSNYTVFSFNQRFASYRAIFTKKEGSVNLPLALGVNFAYEITAGWRVPVPERSMSVAISLPAQSFRFFILTENEPAKIRVKARVTPTQEHPVALRCYADILDNRNKRIPALLPAKVVIKNAGEETEAILYRNFKNGILDCYYPLALNQAPGKYSIEVSAFEISGSAETEYTPTTKYFLRKCRERTVVEIEDREAVRKFITGADDFIIIPGSIAYMKSAEQIKDILARHRKNAVIKMLNEVLPENFTAESADKNQFKSDLPGNLILLGTALDNILIDLAANKYSLTPYQLSELFPGKGKGLIQYSWKTFSPQHDVVIISGSDAAGVNGAAVRFASGRGY